MSGPTFRPAIRPARPQHASVVPAWRRARLTEARTVIAEVAYHSDHLVRMACEVVIRHGTTAAEREDARVLLLVIDARRPVRHAQRDAQRHERDRDASGRDARGRAGDTGEPA